MRILNFGSLNIDHVYRVKHFVRPGETLNSLSYSRFAGGKGANQSVSESYACGYDCGRRHLHRIFPCEFRRRQRCQELS